VDTIRSDGDRPAMALPLSIRHAASTAVAGETDVFLSEVVNSNPGFDGVDRIFEARSRLRGLVTLQECLHEFASHMASLRGETGSSLKTSLIESLHLLLTMAAEVAQTGDEDDRAFLEELTSDRSDMMEGIRRQLLAQPASASMREALLVATVLFERAVWLIRELRMPETQTARIYPTPELVA
jgi:hypothetical protein